MLDAVELRTDGEPLLEGTSIEVHRIAALLGSLDRAEVLHDYPSLTAAQLEAARKYAEAHPKAGRPYPKTTAKRALATAGWDALGELGGHDDDAVAP